MNEEELKNLWQTDADAPTIDFARLQKSLNVWHAKLRRKVKIEIVIQGAATAISLIPVFFFPKMIFASSLVLIIGIWYIRELRGLYKEETDENRLDIKRSLDAKILTMKRFFRRTRIAMYVFSPLILLAAYYGLNSYTNHSATVKNLLFTIIRTFFAYEILTFIATEIYFKILYAPALVELKKLRRQLDFDE